MHWVRESGGPQIVAVFFHGHIHTAGPLFVFGIRSVSPRVAARRSRQRLAGGLGPGVRVARRERRLTDELLAKIAGCADENPLHDLRGVAKTQTIIDRLGAKFPDLAAEVTTAFTAAFNDLAIGVVAK